MVIESLLRDVCEIKDRMDKIVIVDKEEGMVSILSAAD